jgi:hypothetical protein
MAQATHLLPAIVCFSARFSPPIDWTDIYELRITIYERT